MKTLYHVMLTSPKTRFMAGNGWQRLLIEIPEGLLSETKIKVPPMLVISEVEFVRSTPKTVYVQFKDFWRPTRVNPDTPRKYLARNAAEIVSKYLDRIKDKKSMTPSTFSKLSDYLGLQFTLRQIY